MLPRQSEQLRQQLWAHACAPLDSEVRLQAKAIATEAAGLADRCSALQTLLENPEALKYPETRDQVCLHLREIAFHARSAAELAPSTKHTLRRLEDKDRKACAWLWYPLGRGGGVAADLRQFVGRSFGSPPRYLWSDLRSRLS